MWPWPLAPSRANFIPLLILYGEFFFRAQRQGQVVRYAEADAPYVIGHSVRVLLQYAYALITVMAVYLRSQVVGNAMIFEKNHYVAYGLLVFPFLQDGFDLLFADARYFVQASRFVFYDVERLLSEGVHQAVGEYRAYAVYQAAGQVSSDACLRGRHLFSPAVGSELSSEAWMEDPFAVGEDGHPLAYVRERARYRHRRGILAARFAVSAAEYCVTRVRRAERDCGDLQMQRYGFSSDVFLFHFDLR